MRLRNVHNDKRGEIHVIEEFLKYNKEITLIHTNKGFARGGCNHELNDEYHIVVEGQMKYILGNNSPHPAHPEGVETYLLSKGHILRIPRNTPHYCVALEDSITIEFGTTPEEQGTKYAKFRKIVEEINERN